MSKIVCDVCGTRYPDTAEQCPICGYANVGEARVEKTRVEKARVEKARAEKTESADMFEQESRPKVRGGRFSKKNVRKRNQGKAPKEKYEEPPKARSKQKRPEPEVFEVEEEFEEQPRKKSGGLLNVLLILVILALLAVTAYIAVEYFLPNVLNAEPTVPVTDGYEQTDPTVTEEPTTEPTVPCTGLTLDVEEIVLDSEGQAYLLNVVITPEDTTDEISYISSDEAVAVVNSEGRVTAVGDGEAVIYILCGDQALECTVRCELAEETEESTEEPTEEVTEAPTEPLKDVKLSVHTTDTTLRVRNQQTTIKLTCDLKSTEVTWTSDNEEVVTVDENGVVTRVGKGTTNVICKYGDQEVKIIVRCP